jgi:ABC-type transport system involved in multi-copper enzyme maturation permease subunit
VDDERNTVDCVPLLITSEESYAKSTADTINGYGKTKDDPAGPFNLAVISTKSNYSANVQQDSHVFAAGSTAMLKEDYIKYNGNGEYLFNVYKMMVDETELEVAGATKTVTSSYMTLGESTTTWAYIIILGLIPVLCLVIGAIVFIRRRFL